MFKRSTSGAGLLVGAAILAVYATPAHTATIKWRVGPLELAAGQAAEVGVSNTNIFPCTIGVQISAGLMEKRGDAFVLTSVVDTFSDPEHVPAGHGLVVGISTIPTKHQDLPSWCRLGCRLPARPARTPRYAGSRLR